MQQLFLNLTTKQKIALVAVILLIPVVIIVSVVMMNLPKGPIAKIQNLDQYMTTASDSDKYKLQSNLYKFLKSKHKADIEELNIYIRDNSYKENGVDDEDKMADFIIDIEEIKASYTVSFVFPGNNLTSENPTFDCPALSEMKYPETNCKGMYNSTEKLQQEQASPINAILPIVVDEFDKSTGKATRYDIRGFFDAENDYKFNITIIDYSCGNKETALQVIRDKGFNPDDYTIVYQDECFTKHLPYIGQNSMGNKFKISMTTTNEGKIYFMIDNYSCGNQKVTEASTISAATSWLLTRNLKLSNYEYGVITFCEK